MSKRSTRIVFVFVVAMLSFIASFYDRGSALRSQELLLPLANSQKDVASADVHTDAQGRALYKVVKVVDGDTIDIYKDGKNVKVRLIGIDTPETVDPRRQAQCFGREASAEAHRLLDGSMVAIETDPSQDAYDKYGRLLAYVFLQDGTMVNQQMIAEGYAHEYTYHLPYKYQSDFKKAEKIARKLSNGLWAEDTCAGNTKQ